MEKAHGVRYLDAFEPGGDDRWPPLGLCAIKFWNRQKFKGTNALKRKINPTRVPIEEKESFRWLENLRQSTALLAQPDRCAHIGDRESDIYELFCTAAELGTGFLVRTCVDRLAGDGDHTIADEMADVQVQGLHRVEFRDAKGQSYEALLEIRYRRIRVLPAIGKQKQYPALDLTVIHAQERDAPSDRATLEWKLLTNLPVRSKADAIEKINWACHALEDRDLPQDSENRLPGRGLAANCRAADQLDLDLLHPELGDLLDDNAQSHRSAQ
jgi:hypothetical protein